ncbi:MAG: hypothetical protein I3274_04185 [Candidatus Moeniiplasma glomeromycotorum]|nr:hypothetical protein [Candidatus Moeniiplasma glomeromycotorum]MCE8167878.1 hypothetical protein [Candidatus Moeniiplasma glomeromycotorum]
MSENQDNNQQNQQIKSSELAETDSFERAVAALNARIEKKDLVIKELKDKLGKREERISELAEQYDNEKSLRIDAEQKVTSQKGLEKPGSKYVSKTKEERFAEQYQEACEQLRNKK